MGNVNPPSICSDIPARLDRLPWSGWHWRVVIALGVSWLLDGLEVTVVGSLGPALQRDDTLGLSAGEIGWAASAYGRVEEAEAIVRDIEKRVGAAEGAHPELAMRALRAIPMARRRARHRRALPQPRGAGAHADGFAGVLLQRHLLHLRAHAHALLRHRRGARGLLHLSIRARQLPRAAAPRAAVRRRGPARRRWRGR